MVDGSVEDSIRSDTMMESAEIINGPRELKHARATTRSGHVSIRLLRRAAECTLFRTHLLPVGALH